MPGDETYESGTTWVFSCYPPTKTFAEPGDRYFGQSLVSAVNSGQVSQARIKVGGMQRSELSALIVYQDLATRILAAWYASQQDCTCLLPTLSQVPAWSRPKLSCCKLQLLEPKSRPTRQRLR